MTFTASGVFLLTGFNWILFNWFGVTVDEGITDAHALGGGDETFEQGVGEENGGGGGGGTGTFKVLGEEVINGGGGGGGGTGILKLLAGETIGGGTMLLFSTWNELWCAVELEIAVGTELCVEFSIGGTGGVGRWSLENKSSNDACTLPVGNALPLFTTSWLFVFFFSSFLLKRNFGGGGRGKFCRSSSYESATFDGGGINNDFVDWFWSLFCFAENF